jgi:uncharacterized glyoxalase superfamily protein PhnB
MPDPFDLLRSALAPQEPDPAFAAGLRDRIARAFDLPRGVTVSALELDDRAAAATNRSVLTPYLAVRGAREALEWYREAFGAELVGEPIVMPDGRVGHAELAIGGATLFLSDESPAIGVTAPVLGEGTPVSLHLEVPDVDAVIHRAVGLGARLTRAAADYDYGRNGVIQDPFGHRWMIVGVPPAHRLGPGDLSYASLWVPDAARAADFFAAVLGWRYAPAGGPGERQVEGGSVPHGVVGGRGPTLYCCYAVADIAAALDAVRAGGGVAGRPEPRPYGLVAECRDDQGVAFALHQPPDAVAETRGPRRPSPGDLAYVSMEVVDAARARNFYGAVLGWRFVPGRVADGWQVVNVDPLVGVSGGHAVACSVPMYRVADIADALHAVRSMGGAASEPERQPYGITSTCTDDQGTRFYLGQLSD